MDRIAVSISHESDYAVAIAFGVRTAGGRYVFPPDIEERLDDRERRILARMERLRALHEEADAGPTPATGRRRPTEPMADAAGRVRAARRAGAGGRAAEPPIAGAVTLDDAAAAALLPERAEARPQGHVRQGPRHRRLARLRRRGAPRLPRRRAGPAPAS